MSEPTPPNVDPTAPSLPDAGTTGLAPNIAGGLAALFPLIGGIIFFILEKKNAFVRFVAMQSIFLGGLAAAVSVALWVAGLVFGHLPLIGALMLIVLGIAHFVFSIVWFIAYVVAVVKAFTSQEWEIPWLGKLARKQLAQIDTASTPPAA